MANSRKPTVVKPPPRRFMIRLPQADYDLLTQIASVEGQTVAAFTRQVVQNYLRQTDEHIGSKQRATRSLHRKVAQLHYSLERLLLTALDEWGGLLAYLIANQQLGAFDPHQRDQTARRELLMSILQGHNPTTAGVEAFTVEARTALRNQRWAEAQEEGRHDED